jgi:PIN domain nuclease of toxin-antitoxin system
VTTRGLLLDTHAFLWWALGDRRLPSATRTLIDGAGDVYVSAATAWELRTKYRLGKLPELSPLLVHDLAAVVASEQFRELPITFADGDRAGAFPPLHRDPFDRILAAQALHNRLALVSNDAALDLFGVARVWHANV